MVYIYRKVFWKRWVYWCIWCIDYVYPKVIQKLGNNNKLKCILYIKRYGAEGESQKNHDP